jgi:16S rRNA processing protein RimM
MGPKLPARWVLLGRIVGVFGVKGWVRIESHTRPREAIFGYSPWGLGLKTGWERRAVHNGEARGKSLVAKIEGIEDRELARELIGTEIAVPRADLPAPEKGEIYWADLVGCSVVNLENQDFGKVTGLLETGANDVLIVKGEKERLIPYTDQVVKEVDLDQALIRVDWDIDF